MLGMPIHTAVATIHTNHGDIVVNLFGDHAPRTVQNFTGLADGSQAWTHPATGKPGEGPLYKDVIFHRIIPNFMIQGGDPMANAGLRRNAITGKAEGTNGSQFFITTDPTPWLNGKHTIFGEVADDASRAVVDAISAVPTAAGDRPIEPVVISSIDVVPA